MLGINLKKCTSITKKTNNNGIRATNNFNKKSMSFHSTIQFKKQNHNQEHNLSKQQISSELYPNHIPTSCFQKALMAAGSSVLGFVNPQRGDMIAIFGETTAAIALQNMRDQMKKSEEGKEILETKPRIHENNLNLEELRKLPPDTLGGAYSRYMLENNFLPSERTPVRFVDDPELAYVMTRYREIHDFVHAITGMKPTVIGELAVKWFEWSQTGLPMCGLSSLVGPLRLSLKEQYLLFSQLVPWAVRCGRSADSVLGIYYEKHLDVKISELQKKYNIIPAPFTI
eukprot:gb/GECH01000111.1/.p1 GENE.gb/GECH01000111.1/~~gb/GECH01000111.1/.p1  ORF type:complete len:285 (+),score=58.58 gb/GECH01000111.1/:1-855(+)